MIDRLVDVTHAGSVNQLDDFEPIPQKKPGREDVVAVKIKMLRQRHIGDEEITWVPHLMLVESRRQDVGNVRRHGIVKLAASR